MRRKATVPPGEEIADSFLRDQAVLDEHPQHLGAQEPLDVLGVGPGERPEGAVRQEATVRQQHVDVGVEVEKLPCRLNEPHRARDHLGAVEVRREVELQGPPGTGGELAEELSVVAQEHPEPLGDGEDRLAVGNVFEQLLLGPHRPKRPTRLFQGPYEALLYPATLTQAESNPLSLYRAA